MGELARKTSDIDEMWYWYLSGNYKEGLSSKYVNRLKLERSLYGVLPGSPRCIE